MEQIRSKKPLIFFIATLVLSIVAVFLLVNKYSSNPTDNDSPPPSSNTPSSPANGTDAITLTPNGNHVDNVNTGHKGTPEELVGHISNIASQANKTGDISPLITALGQRNLTPQQIKRLHNLALTSKLKLDNPPFSSITPVGNRWSLNLANRNRILLDLEQSPVGKWQVKRIALPNNITGGPGHIKNPATLNDKQKASAAVNAFLHSIINLDPASARTYIDPSKVSYARLAGLCIIFEEGQYQLIKDRPLRQMFLRNTTAGWLARVEAQGNGTSAMFAINTKRKDPNSPWKITEISLDKLLADYTNRFSGGDIHYTPLIKTPKGGDSLVIYFDLDSDNLSQRSQRQLSIVANLLKADQQKKLTISGHTDALGSDSYNLALSEKRAKQTMAFLSAKGVNNTQMKIAGFGKSKPRVPNTTEEGADNPGGRRANRRAEILLDF